jgi:hypothetical protein
LRNTLKVKPVQALNEEHKIMVLSPMVAMSKVHFINNQNEATGYTVKTAKVMY